MPSCDTLLQILDLARWAPSGDNTQPWRFEIVEGSHLRVHAFDTRDYCVYDLDGRPSQLSVGLMLETLRLAAASHGLSAGIARQKDSPQDRPVFDVHLLPDASASSSPLVAAIKSRCVQRRPLSTGRLPRSAKTALRASLPNGYTLVWMEGLVARWRVALLLYASARIRLTIPEAFETHRRVIEWGARYSEDKIPDEAVGLDPLTKRLMRWFMRDWRRMQFVNRYLGGTIVPRLQLDLLPGLACAAHVVIVADRAPTSIDDYVMAGAAVQRFWLTATTLGLQHQPETTPLIFARYVRERRAFSARPGASGEARDIEQRLGVMVGIDVLPRAVWMGRLGVGPPAKSRSLRLPLSKLMCPPSPAKKA